MKLLLIPVTPEIGEIIYHSLLYPCIDHNVCKWSYSYNKFWVLKVVDTASLYSTFDYGFAPGRDCLMSFKTVFYFWYECLTVIMKAPCCQDV